MGYQVCLWGLQAERTVGRTSESCPGGVPELQDLHKGGSGPWVTWGESRTSYTASDIRLGFRKRPGWSCS